MSSASTQMSPMLMPMRNATRRCAGASANSVANAVCMSSAALTALSTVENSARKPSPVSLTMRPRWRATVGSMTSLARAAPGFDDLGLVELHQARVAGDVGREDRGEPLRKVRCHLAGPRLGSRADYTRASSTLD